VESASNHISSQGVGTNPFNGISALLRSLGTFSFGGMGLVNTQAQGADLEWAGSNKSSRYSGLMLKHLALMIFSQGKEQFTCRFSEGV